MLGLTELLESIGFCVDADGWCGHKECADYRVFYAVLVIGHMLHLLLSLDQLAVVLGADGALDLAAPRPTRLLPLLSCIANRLVEVLAD